MIFVMLCLTYLMQYESLQLHPHCCEWHYFLLFLWLSSIPLYICTASSVSTPMQMDIWFLSLSVCCCDIYLIHCHMLLVLGYIPEKAEVGTGSFGTFRQFLCISLIFATSIKAGSSYVPFGGGEAESQHNWADQEVDQLSLLGCAGPGP